MNKYDVYRANDGHIIKSNDVTFSSNGIWINDDLETNNSNIKLFIPYFNVNQVIITDIGKSK